MAVQGASSHGEGIMGPHHGMQREASQDSLGRDTCYLSLVCVQGCGSMAGLEVQLQVLVAPETPMLLGVPQP